MAKAILINTEEQTLLEITINHWKEIYQHIGNDCTTFCCPVNFANGDTMYCDDEALCFPERVKGGIFMEDWVSPLVGNIVLLGTDEDGEDKDVQTTIEELRHKIKFMTLQQIIRWSQC